MTMVTVHNEPALELQLLKAARQRKFLASRVHEHTCHCRFGGTAGTPQHRHAIAQRRENAVSFMRGDGRPIRLRRTFWAGIADRNQDLSYFSAASLGEVPDGVSRRAISRARSPRRTRAPRTREWRPVHAAGLLIIGHGRRQILWFGVTAHPMAEWLANQLTEACGWGPN